MMENNRSRPKAYLIFCLVAILGISVHVKLWNVNKEMEREDVYFVFVEGGRLLQGVNPYERVLSGDMRTNEKYATYLPLSYLLSGGVQLAGLRSFPAWLTFWRVASLGCVLGIGYLIFRICTAADQHLLGIFGALFWLLNRWTLHVTVVGHIDFLPLLLLLLSLSLLQRRFALACVLFGLSLAIKQMAIFALPLYLIQAWQMGRPNPRKHLLTTFALIVAVPVLVSIPFLIWNAEGYIKSILFSATRNPVGHFGAPSLDALFGYSGIAAKIPVLLLLGLTYALAARRRVPPYASLLLVMTVFCFFNSVFFRQYTVWILPFIPLTIHEMLSASGRASEPLADG